MNSRLSSPPDGCRPLQFMPPFEDWPAGTADSAEEGLRRLWDLGIRGVVVTVNLEQYLSSEPAWAALRHGVEKAAGMGLRVWIYDEKGYPSGAAGGLVLERVPDAEARGLVRKVDAAGEIRYDVVRLYDNTHATENFYARRPYINILDPGAVTTFLEVTHDRYHQNLSPLDRYVEAFFTDEPSLIAAYIPQGRDYPQTLPWHPGLPKEFHQRKGYDLLPHLESLYRDVGHLDRKIRCDFYAVIADLCAETYFSRLQDWCHTHGVRSSGHLLGEETMVWQTLFEGDPFTCYPKFDIPGIDMILSDPGKIMHEKYFLVPKLASSAAHAEGKRKVMCEISDFLGAYAGRHASVEQMCCTASILSSLGVTEFVSMYPLPSAAPHPSAPLSNDDFRLYTDHTARVNAVLGEGIIDVRLAVLHPLRTVWAHFTPSHRSMYEPHPDSTVHNCDEAFADLCRTILQHQMDFEIVDERSVAGATVTNGVLAIGDRRFDALILPPMDTLCLPTAQTLTRFMESGGLVIAHALRPQHAAEGPDSDMLIRKFAGSIPFPPRKEPAESADIIGSARALVASNCDLFPSAPGILCTKVVKGDSSAYLLVNTSSDPYTGTALFLSAGTPTAYDPTRGKSSSPDWKRESSGRARITLALQPFQSLFFIFTGAPVESGFERKRSPGRVAGE